MIILSTFRLPSTSAVNFGVLDRDPARSGASKGDALSAVALITKRTNYPIKMSPSDKTLHITSESLAGPTSTSGTDSARNAKSFYDLPPETRNFIYLCLFRGQNIPLGVRSRPTVLGRLHSPGNKHSGCGKSLGLNILFVSKACFAEAKPVLFKTATFDLGLCTPGVPVGPSPDDLSFVRSIKCTPFTSSPIQIRDRRDASATTRED